MIAIGSLTTEYRVNPLGLDEPQPRLGWINASQTRKARQSAYRILVSANAESLTKDIGDVWDSGRREGDRNSGIAYSGLPLESATRYYWKVLVWDEDGRPSSWSEPAWWETALLRPEEWEAAWLTSPGDHAPLFRKDFEATGPISRARLYIAAAGYCEIYLNGLPVGDRKLDPAFTSYDKRHLYVTYEAESYLKQGNNSIGVELGRGFYGLRTPNVWNWHQTKWNANPKFIARLAIEYVDGTRSVLVTDDSWGLIEKGPTTRDCVYTGESYDARLRDEEWNRFGYGGDNVSQAIKAAGPHAPLQAQTLPPIRIVDAVQPAKMTKLGDGHYIFDMGVVMTGWAEIAISGGQAGYAVTIVYSETLDSAGRAAIAQTAVDGPIQSDRYTKRGGQTEKWEPRFSYKGFQYIEISGSGIELALEDVVGKQVQTDLRPSGRFSCSNDLFNRIHEATRRTLRNNIHGILTDTPTYEKNGWLGDAQLIAETANYQFDLSVFWEKWLIDIGDAQREDGFVPVIVPDSGWGSLNAPEWSCAFVFVAWQLYWHYDDIRVLKRHYLSLKKYAAYEISRLADGAASSDLGDWVAPGYLEGRAPEGGRITASFHMYKALKIMAEIEKLVGADSECMRYERLADEVAEALNRDCLDREAGCYRTGKETGYRQTSNLLPLAASLVPDAARQSVEAGLIADIRDKRGHADVGIIGHKYFYPTLTRLGYGDLAFEAATKTDYPSMGLWFEEGATTLWEYWDASSRSRNHYMFGSVVQWYYEYVAGIRQTAAGWRRWQVKPYLLGDLTSGEATLDTVLGRVHVGWSLGDRGAFRLIVHVPVGSIASVHVPANAGGYTIHEVESGKYEFESELIESYRD
ncbi:family 78 glycoside hydrolase catalytic domain [Cohnella sp. GCM10020058]|uniref:family 78 glycoside hydrolase catalytic domain n=1 Tax=Cohnella sp. GCM10020058 TaxID=3317330 RepID=UPI0036327BC0